MAINLYPEGLVTNASFHKNDIRLCVTWLYKNRLNLNGFFYFRF
jgi:hypothetical protein